MTLRPPRKRLPDFSGRLVSLPCEISSWQRLKSGGRDLLLYGLGPEKPWELPFIADALKSGAHIYWLEEPAISAALNALQGLPNELANQWQRVECSDLPGLLNTCEIWFYTPGLRLAPDFWSRLIAQAELDAFSDNLPPKKLKAAWLPGQKGMLLHQELACALKNLGYKRVYAGYPAPYAESALPEWRDGLPELAISVNFRGLDEKGRVFELCRELAIPLAIWLVDNPFNILSGIPLPWWREANLFITDQSFEEPLKRYGAKNVWTLPLAAGGHMLEQTPKRSLPPIFVGSSAFPARNRYFAGLRLDPQLEACAQELMASGQRPDFHWWQNQSGVELWPGKEGRLAAFGADQFSARLRAQWVKQAQASGLELIGDAGWSALLPNARLHKPVDYYAELPGLYAGAECTLNVTSLLLPESLNQRHFDVWSAGGFLLTDYSKGLSIFPDELTEPVILKKPEDFAEKLAFFRERKAEKASLASGWAEHIQACHTYEDRVRKICAELGVI